MIRKMYEERSSGEVLGEFQKIIRAYAKDHGLTMRCEPMDLVQGALLALVEDGADYKHNRSTLVALAAIMAGLMIPKIPLGAPSAAAEESDSRRGKAIGLSASWLARRQGWGVLAWSVSWAYGIFLEYLLEEYFPSSAQQEVVEHPKMA